VIGRVGCARDGIEAVLVASDATIHELPDLSNSELTITSLPSYTMTSFTGYWLTRGPAVLSRALAEQLLQSVGW
jgi:hypothetical protein